MRRAFAERFHERDVDAFLSHLLGECDFPASPQRASMMRAVRRAIQNYLKEAGRV